MQACIFALTRPKDQYCPLGRSKGTAGYRLHTCQARSLRAVPYQKIERLADLRDDRSTFDRLCVSRRLSERRGRKVQQVHEEFVVTVQRKEYMTSFAVRVEFPAGTRLGYVKR